MPKGTNLTSSKEVKNGQEETQKVTQFVKVAAQPSA